MTIIINVQEAKTRLSELLHRAEAGQEIVIARAGRAVARLEPVAPRRRALSEPLLTGLPPIDATELLSAPDPSEIGAWEQGHEHDPLSAGAASG